MTIDNLLAAEIVTADGEVLQVDAEHHPDLFWAIRGGGGNFGVVDPVPVPAPRRQRRSSAACSSCRRRPRRSPGFIAAADAAPEELSTIANVMPCPPMPFVPEEHHGKLVIFALIGCVGEPDAAARDDRPVPGARDAARGHGPADALRRRSTRPRTPTTDPRRSAGRCSSTASTETDGRLIVDRLTALGRRDAGRPAARPRRRDGPRARRRHRVRPSREPDHGQRRGVLRGPGRPGASASAGSTDFHARPPAGRRGRVRELRRRRGRGTASAPPTRARRGIASARSSAATTRTTSSGATRTCHPRRAEPCRTRSRSTSESRGSPNATFRPAGHEPGGALPGGRHRPLPGDRRVHGRPLRPLPLEHARGSGRPRPALSPEHLGVVLRDLRDGRAVRRDGLERTPGRATSCTSRRAASTASGTTTGQRRC